MRTTTTKLSVLALTLVVLAATPAYCGDGFLKHVDTLMRNYSDSFYKDGSPGDIAEKFFRGGPKTWFSLKEIDTTMKGYADANQKVGEQALADLKVCLKDLISFKTYLPDGLVEGLATLKARFLARCEKPWADDAGGGGAASLDVPDVSAPSADDGALPDDAPKASSIRIQGKDVVDPAGMTDSFDAFVGFRKGAQKAIAAAQKLDDAKRSAVTERVVRHAHEMEDKLIAKLANNDTAIKALADYMARLDGATAKGCFSALLAKLSKVVNAGALSNPKARSRAAAVSALRAKIGK